MAHTPDMPASFRRFTNAVQPDDTRADFFTESGTYTGRGQAPAHKATAAGGEWQDDIFPTDDDGNDTHSIGASLLGD